MPTLRDQLRARRATYLERIAVSDLLKCHEPYDIRVASVRGFLEGGDDLPPECEKKGAKPERRRLPAYISDEVRNAAKARLDGPKKAQPSDAGDWDYFLKARDEGGKTDLFRLIAQLVRATEYFKRGVVIPPHQVLELFASKLPSPADKEESVQKAWHLLRICGVYHEEIAKSYLHLIEDVGIFKTSDVNVTDVLPKIVHDWINGFGGRNPITDGQKCPPGPAPPERIWKEDCPCQPPPKKSQGVGGSGEPPTLDSAIRDSREAVFAAFRTSSAQAIMDEFRFIGMTDQLIAQILLWLKQRWEAIEPDYRAVLTTGEFAPRYPQPDAEGRVDPPITVEEAKLTAYFEYWMKEVETLSRLRKVPQYFMALSRKSTREVCAEIFKGLWPDDDSPAYNEETLEKSGITRDDFLGAVDRAVADNSREDGPFRLAALLKEPEGYIRVLDKVGPAGEDGTGANGLAKPTHTPTSALYWREVIVPSTIGHILTMADTADFHIAHHIRFLGLFSRGGRYRTGKPEDAKYEAYISELVPDWVIRFITAALLRVKYWVSDRPLERPNGEEMAYWSENHQMLFASAEYILPSLVPAEENFAYLDKSPSWHRDRAMPRMRAWLDHKLQFGYSEVNSGVYYNQHLPGLFNLVDFAPDEEIRKRALIALDLMIFDIVRRVCQGSFVAASGRQYWGAKCSGWSCSVLDTIELLTGSVSDFWSTHESSAISFVTSRYMEEIPEVLLAIAHDTAAPRIDRSRTSINLGESEDYGIDPESSDGIVFWWGNGAYFTDDTYRATQSWSYRWGLRKTGPFRYFKWIDMAISRLVMAVLNFFASAVGIVVSALRQQLFTSVLSYFSGIFKPLHGAQAGPTMMYGGGFPITLLNGAMVTPQVLRRLLDVALSVLDVAIGFAAGVMKTVGILDENDDRVRVAYPALEQEFRELAIKFNAGSLLERQHLYGWRSRDAMLTSFNENHKGATSFQGEPCLATLGLNVSVFTGKRPHADGSDFGQAVEGYVKGVARYAYDPEVFLTSQVGVFGGESAPEWGAFAAPLLSGELFGDEGPGYWFGNLSQPLVYQHENVAVSIYSPSDLQDDLGPDETHAHWPFDHFDEFITDEKNGGRWVFGRRDRRFPPRTPCQPGPGRPTTEEPHWPKGKRREEGGAGSGYIALFSARGMKTLAGSPYGHRELVADGEDNIWITIVGDRATYHTFTEFHDDVLAATLNVDVDDLACSITMPDPGSAKSGQKGNKFEVSWDDGAKIDGKKIETDGWPRFEWKRSSLQATRAPVFLYDLRIDDVLVTSKQEPGKGRVDWDEKSWRIEAKVRAWEEKEENRKKKWVETQKLLFVEHDFSNDKEIKRQPSAEGLQTFHPIVKPTLSVSEGIAAATQQPQKTVKSILGQRFRESRKAFQLRR